MTTTNLNIRTDKDVKEQAEQIFNELGLNMTSAVEEGRRIVSDNTVKGYSSMEALKKALEV